MTALFHIDSQSTSRVVLRGIWCCARLKLCALARNKLIKAAPKNCAGNRATDANIVTAKHDAYAVSEELKRLNP
jgi:hypothetical protein